MDTNIRTIQKLLNIYNSDNPPQAMKEANISDKEMNDYLKNP